MSPKHHDTPSPSEHLYDWEHNDSHVAPEGCALMTYPHPTTTPDAPRFRGDKTWRDTVAEINPDAVVVKEADSLFFEAWAPIEVAEEPRKGVLRRVGNAVLGRARG